MFLDHETHEIRERKTKKGKVMNYAMMSYAWSRQAPDQEAVDVKEMFRVTKRLGFDAMNMVTLYGHEPEEIRSIADDFGIDLFCYTFLFDVCGWGGEKSDPELAALLKKELDAAETLGTSKVMLLPCGKEGISRLENRTKAIARLQKFVPMIMARGIMPMVEDYPSLDGPFLCTEDLREAVAGVPGLKLIFDSGNALIAGEDPCEMFKSLAGHIAHVHFADLAEDVPGFEADKLSLDGKAYASCVLSSGDVDYPELLRVMKQAGYNGYIEIEYQGDECPAEEGIRRSLEYLRGIEDN